MHVGRQWSGTHDAKEPTCIATGLHAAASVGELGLFGNYGMSNKMRDRKTFCTHLPRRQYHGTRSRYCEDVYCSNRRSASAAPIPPNRDFAKPHNEHVGLASINCSGRASDTNPKASLKEAGKLRAPCCECSTRSSAERQSLPNPKARSSSKMTTSL